MKLGAEVPRLFHAGPFRYALTLLASVLFAYFAYLAFSGFGQYRWSIDYTWLTASFLLLMLAFVTGALGWKMILDRIGITIPFDLALTIWVTSQLGKYLPIGTVWYLMGRIALAQRNGMARRDVILSLIIEMGLLVAGGSAFFLLSTLGWRDVGQTGFVITAVMLLSSLLILLWPPMLSKLTQFAPTRFAQSLAVNTLQPRDLVLLAGFYLLQWALLGSAFYLLAGSFHSLSLQALMPVAGAFAISCVVGYVVVFVPNGIGIREAALVSTLGLFLPTPVALTVAVLSRIWYSVTEVACALIVLAMRSRNSVPGH